GQGVQIEQSLALSVGGLCIGQVIGQLDVSVNKGIRVALGRRGHRFFKSDPFFLILLHKGSFAHNWNPFPKVKNTAIWSTSKSIQRKMSTWIIRSWAWGSGSLPF